MEVAFGRLHNGGRAAFGRPPTVVDSIMGAGEAAGKAKTYANVYQISAYLHILPIFLYSPYWGPGAI